MGDIGVLKVILRSFLLCKHKKFPGLDGLIYEFYLKYFELLKHGLRALFNGILARRLTLLRHYFKFSKVL